MYSVAWSPDGRRLATGAGDGKALVWDVAAGTHTHLDHGKSDVRSVAWSPDWKRLATGASGGKVRVWDVAAGTAESLGRGGSPSFSVAWSPDGNRLATGAIEGVRLYEAREFHLLMVIASQTKLSITRTAWNPDGHRLAITQGWRVMILDGSPIPFVRVNGKPRP